MCARLFARATIGPCIEVKKDTKWRAGPTGSVENDPTKTLKESVLCIGSVRGL
jgi:hypothetical protein